MVYSIMVGVCRIIRRIRVKKNQTSAQASLVDSRVGPQDISAGMLSRFRVSARCLNAVPRGSRYQIIKDLDPKSHNNHGL